MDIHQILISALNKRDIFHSEADFQHHLAWEIHSFSGDSSDIRLEFPLSKSESKRWEYCDILVRKPSPIGIELKYKTKRSIVEVNNEVFELKQQGAQDLGRYDFLKDINRLEFWCKQNQISRGYAILLTNDSSYWSAPVQLNTVDKAFRLHHNEVGGQLKWDAAASKGTTKGRERSIELHGHYSLKWFDSPRIGFKYLFVKVEC